MQRDVDKKEDGIFNPGTATCQGKATQSGSLDREVAVSFRRIF